MDILDNVERNRKRTKAQFWEKAELKYTETQVLKIIKAANKKYLLLIINIL